MEPVGFGTLMLTPRQITGLGNLSPLWLGDVLTHEGDARMYLKRATDNNEILSECLCAVIGRALDLPIPRPYLVQDPQDLLGGQILIGSEDVDTPSLRHSVDLDMAFAIQGFLSWPLLRDAVVFDEWIANPDRNLGNLLWDGRSNWTMIDHARSLGAWPPNGPVPQPDAGVRNILAELINELPGDLESRRLDKKAATCADAYRQVDRQSAFEAAQCEALGMGERAQDALSFLEARIDRLPYLVARHGSQPRLNL